MENDIFDEVLNINRNWTKKCKKWRWDKNVETVHLSVEGERLWRREEKLKKKKKEEKRQKRKKKVFQIYSSCWS